MKKRFSGKALRYLSGLIFCNLYRLLRIFPNNDPIMGFALPFAKRDKWWQAMIFPMLAMVSFDLLVARLGIWTVGTSLAYGFLGLFFYFYLKKKKSSLKTYAKGSVFGILVFDFLTGPVMSSAMFRIPFTVAFLGQIPFTAMHLFSGVSLMLIISPLVDPDLRKTTFKTIASVYRRIDLSNWQKLIAYAKEPKIFVPCICLIFLLAFSGCTQEQLELKTVAVSIAYLDKDGVVIAEKSIEVENGTNAFDVMKENFEVEYDSYDFGPFIKSIEGVAPPETHYLALYVNGEYASKGISDYAIEEGTAIEWKTETIEGFGLE